MECTPITCKITVSLLNNYDIVYGHTIFPHLCCNNYYTNIVIEAYSTSNHLLCFSSQGGMQAVRENRYIILSKDFEKAYKKAIKKDDQEHDFYK